MFKKQLTSGKRYVKIYGKIKKNNQNYQLIYIWEG